MIKIYPEVVEKYEKNKDNIGAQIFGNRFIQDQTLYEYLIEFLLVFVSAKENDLKTGKLRFHKTGKCLLQYWVEPRMGLKRFIFYDKSQKNRNLPIDEEAYQELIRTLKKNIPYGNETDKNEIINGIQDLLHGYAVIIKKRNWCAQALLPACPEMIFPDVMPAENKRRVLTWSDNADIVDTKFEFSKRNFLARGGEVYYLHILEALEDDSMSLQREKLEKLLTHMLTGENKKLSYLCNFVQNSWEKTMGFNKEDLSERISLSFIPKEAYLEAGRNTVKELINYLSCELPSINRIEILAKGVMFQIMRMMSWRVDEVTNDKKYWIVDMKGGSTDSVKKIAAKSYRDIEDGFLTALNSSAREINIDKAEYMKKLNKAKKASMDTFRIKGKEIQCIIPTNGPFERFTLSEDITIFLVLSLIPPKQKMTLNMFLEKLYSSYRIIIGPVQYKKSVNNNGLDDSLTNSFVENAEAFQLFLKSTGFLRELSDATSVVINPYDCVAED